MSYKIRTQKVTAEKPRSVLVHYVDNATESQDEVITPGAGASIRGSLLKYDEADPEQGVFFVKSDGTVTKVTEKLMRNKPGELIFIVPNGLSSGSYRVEVHTRLKNVKELRMGALAANLTVGQP